MKFHFWYWRIYRTVGNIMLLVAVFYYAVNANWVMILTILGLVATCIGFAAEYADNPKVGPRKIIPEKWVENYLGEPGMYGDE